MSYCVNVALNLPVKKNFSYFLADKPEFSSVGKRVKVSFGPRTMVGIIVEEGIRSHHKNTKYIERIIDEKPVVSPNILALAEWMADYYVCSLGEALTACLPGLKTSASIDLPSTTQVDCSQKKDKRFKLSQYQAAAIDKIRTNIKSHIYKEYLLHGVTASGKTEVYLQLIECALKEDLGAIVCVPEISLTPQTIERFRHRFGSQIALMHSQLTDKNRRDEWARLHHGDARIAIGARSAIFAPIKNLGIIIIDEEHEWSYKQDDVPRYHARGVARKRAEIESASLLLGSATPAIETYHRARRGAMELCSLPERVDEKQFPEIHLIDMKRDTEPKKGIPIISRPLRIAIEKALRKGEQVILFMNRRGFSTFIYCEDCGYVYKCTHCEVSFVYHQHTGMMICHYCNKREKLTEICTKCKGTQISSKGFGTEKIEFELRRIFKEARVLRMDSDVTKKRGAHEHILEEFRQGKADILVGTQMIAKGLDYPNVTVVGVVSADVTLNLPDFRACERTYALMMQVAGRCGRGEEKGHVYIQSYTPQNYAILLVKNSDYHGFYEKEIAIRKELSYPPFRHIISVFARSKTEKTAITYLEKIKAFIKKEKNQGVLIDGPAPKMIVKMAGVYRWQLLLRTEDVGETSSLINRAIAAHKKSGSLYVGIDVDAISL